MQTIALAQWAHDIRNTLATIALHLETLERPAEPDTLTTVARASTLLAKAAGMCSAAIRDVGSEAPARRHSFDVMMTIGQVFDLIAPLVPAPTTLRVMGHGPVLVMADPQDVFRILFNLIHNAVTVARQSKGIREIELHVEQIGSAVTISIADDGPGLPEQVRSTLFRRGRSTTGGSGYGLSIARELAERNGGVLELAPSRHGTVFVLELQRAGGNVRRIPIRSGDGPVLQASIA